MPCVLLMFRPSFICDFYKADLIVILCQKPRDNSTKLYRITKRDFDAQQFEAVTLRDFVLDLIPTFIPSI